MWVMLLEYIRLCVAGCQKLAHSVAVGKACIIPLAIGDTIVPLLLERKEKKGPAVSCQSWSRLGEIALASLSL